MASVIQVTGGFPNGTPLEVGEGIPIPLWAPVFMPEL